MLITFTAHYSTFKRIHIHILTLEHTLMYMASRSFPRSCAERSSYFVRAPTPNTPHAVRQHFGFKLLLSGNPDRNSLSISLYLFLCVSVNLSVYKSFAHDKVYTLWSCARRRGHVANTKQFRAWMETPSLVC